MTKVVAAFPSWKELRDFYEHGDRAGSQEYVESLIIVYTDGTIEQRHITYGNPPTYTSTFIMPEARSDD